MNDRGAEGAARPLNAPVPAEQGTGLRILLIDPSALGRSCFRAGLADDSALIFDAFATVAEAQQSLADALAPEVILLQAATEKVGDTMLARQLLSLHQSFPSVPVMLMTSGTSSDVMMAAMRHGIRGLLSAELGVGATLNAMRLVRAGYVIYPEAALDRLRRLTGTAEARAAAAADPVRVLGNGRDMLTARQRDVLRLLAEGLSNKAIAYKLGISDSTVKVHIRAIMERTGLVNRTQIVARFFEERH